jgi:hypothetical protein
MKTLLRPLLVIAICAAGSIAGSTQIWEQKTLEDFEKGESSGISLGAEGKLQLSPPVDLVFETGDPYVWALARDSRGRVFVGGGNEGKVHLLKDGGPSVFFKAREIEIHALAVDSGDNLYVGSSPDGKVYRVAPDGTTSVFFEPKTKYIWALAFDRKGNLYVATGDKGELFKVDTQGHGTVVYKSGDKHVRALASYGDGVIAGTEGRGRIARVSSEGQVFVLYDAGACEISSVAVAQDGAIYATGIRVGSTQPGQPTLRTPAPAAPSSQPLLLESALQGVMEGIGAGPQPPMREPQSSVLYRITSDGYPKQIWKSDRVTAFSVVPLADGSALVGTGDRGLIYKVSADERGASVLARAGGSQVTTLLSDERSKTIYAGTSNLGRLYKIGSGYSAEGSFESQVKDAYIFSKWGHLRWTQESPRGASTRILTRSGNTREPDSTWSPWSEPLSQPSGQQVTSPPARFFQWKVVLSTTNKDVTPVVDNIQLAYLPRNVAPEINPVVLQPRDMAIERMPVVQDQQFSQFTQFSGSGGSSSAPPQAPTPALRFVPTRTSTKRGWQSVTWEARDENGDTLTYSVQIKGDGESEWRTLKDRVEESFFSWDTANFPDGAYTVRIVASDAPSNPPDLTQHTTRVSERFYIDNTPPSINGFTIAQEAQSKGAIRVRFRAIDTATWLNKAEYTVDAGEAHIVFPSDGIFDSESEEFDFVINVSAGEHVVAIKVSDRANNQASAKQVVSVK